jgi:hypothetical protein
MKTPRRIADDNACKFCGCTDRNACAIPMFWSPTPDVDGLRELFGDERFPVVAGASQLADFSTPCHWSAPNVCSAPPCIAQAYREACDLVDRLLEQEFAA